MSVKRYSVGVDGVDPNGNLVKYTDYAALEARCAALAAEMSAVEEIHNEAVFITDDHYEQCPPEVQKIIRSLAVMQIPAYHAFLAEVRAHGVEMFAEVLKNSGAAYQREFYADTGNAYIEASKDAVEFAAQLRKGVQS
ncbi:hypothetical protein ACOY9H_22290 [Enterobacter hormaechei]|uniref:hypothetical protein n=1 Tax=Enterobacter hormaechei TaxID=158836 RepID=UPI0013FE2DF1|nr:hypothetical protein [Enterobacter hormaechei]